ncbi:MAG: transposase DNA-binding-containing protein [Atribacterota bacterium]
MTFLIADELQHANLGDARLNKRLVHLGEKLSEKPTESIPKACETLADIRAAYRFFSSHRLHPAAIRDAHFQKTMDRTSACDFVLAIQDTTDLDFSSHHATTGLGYLEYQGSSGLRVHSTLALTPDGVPLGLLDQIVWTRAPQEKGKRSTRRLRCTSKKESQHFIDALERAEERLPKTVHCLTIADREADLFDLLAPPYHLSGQDRGRRDCIPARSRKG